MWNWDNADTYLKGGRKKYERPLYDRHLRIWRTSKWDPNSDINVGFFGFTFVTYHKDGTTTIRAEQNNLSYAPLRNYSTRLTIMRYANLPKVYQKNFKFYIQEEDAGITPPKIQGCRTCSQTGLIDSWCNPGNCWSVKVDPVNNKLSCDEHEDLIKVNYNSTWHLIPCEHGLQRGHTIKHGQQCYYCKGTKKRDYGSKFEATQWDGSPIRLRDGKIIKSAATLLERMIADYVEPIG